MKIRASLPFDGKCDVCDKEKLVHTAGDEDTHRLVTVCVDCLKKYSDEEIFEKFGRVDEDAFEAGIEKPSDIKYHVEKKSSAS